MDMFMLITTVAVMMLGIIFFVKKKLLKPRDKDYWKAIHIPGGRELGDWEVTYVSLLDRGLFLLSYVLFIDSKEVLTKEILTKASHKIRARHPMLRMRIVEHSDAKGNKRMFFAPTENETVDVETIQSDDWVAVHSKEVGTTFNSQKGPLWRVRLLQNEDNQFPVDGIYKSTVVVTFYQAIIDGVAVMRFVDELMDHLCSAAEGNDELPESLPLPPSVEDFIGLTDMSWKQKLVTVARLLKMRYGPKNQNPYTERFGAEIKRNPDVEIATKIFPIEFSKLDTQIILENSKKHNATVNGVILAACCSAMSRILQGGSLKCDIKFRISYPADMRRFSKPPLDAKESLVNRGIPYFMEVNVPRNIDQPNVFWKFANEITKETHRKIRNGEAQDFLRLQGFLLDLGLSFCSLESSVFEDRENGWRSSMAFLVSNLGNLKYLTKERPRKFELRTKHNGSAMNAWGDVFHMYVATIHGRLLISIVYATHVTTIAQVKEYGDLIVKNIKDACGISE